MSLTEWLLIGLAVTAFVGLVFLYFCLEFLGQIKDMIAWRNRSLIDAEIINRLEKIEDRLTSILVQGDRR